MEWWRDDYLSKNHAKAGVTGGSVQIIVEIANDHCSEIRGEVSFEERIVG